jgi:cytochrome P450
MVRNFATADMILRSRQVRQGMSDEAAKRFQPDRMPVFFLEGDAHREKRSATARYFTPKAVTTRHRAVMERVTDDLLARLVAQGRGQLDDLSLELAVAVTAEIVGLTNSDLGAMSARIDRSLSSNQRNPGRLRSLLVTVRMRFNTLRFFLFDVKPAIDARRKNPKDDMISHLIEVGYSNAQILIECMTYASAGMLTTREFIVMAAWHLFEREALRARFIAADEDEQLAILDEILRLEPIASRLFRRTLEDMELPGLGHVPADTLLGIDIYAANGDEAVTGACPFSLDPDRQRDGKAGGSMLAFGAGHHRCPGWQVAMHESRIFLDRMMKLPGIRLERAPDVGWADFTMSYELRNAIIACDRAQ